MSGTVRGKAVLVGLLAMTLLVGCGGNTPQVPVPVFDNDPVPFPAELMGSLERSLAPSTLQATNLISPPISANKALQVAGATLLEELDGNKVPAQDPSVPDGLVRRMLIDAGRLHRPPTSVWVVGYRWHAGFNCHDPNGGPGPCPVTSFFFIDDQSGELIYEVSN